MATPPDDFWHNNPWNIWGGIHPDWLQGETKKPMTATEVLKRRREHGKAAELAAGYQAAFYQTGCARVYSPARRGGKSALQENIKAIMAMDFSRAESRTIAAYYTAHDVFNNMKELPNMAASKDRVTFYLPSRYFQRHHTTNGMAREVCVSILVDAFGMGIGQTETLLRDTPGGISIVCRPSQFARFITYLYERGNCINGIQDLAPSLAPAYKPTRIIDALHEEASCFTKAAISQLVGDLRALGVKVPDFVPTEEPTNRVDVSGNFSK